MTGMERPATKALEDPKQAFLAEYRRQLELSTNSNPDISYGPQYYINITKSDLIARAKGEDRMNIGTTDQPWHPELSDADCAAICAELGFHVPSPDEIRAEKEKREANNLRQERAREAAWDTLAESLEFADVDDEVLSGENLETLFSFWENGRAEDIFKKLPRSKHQQFTRILCEHCGPFRFSDLQPAIIDEYAGTVDESYLARISTILPERVLSMINRCPNITDRFSFLKRMIKENELRTLGKFMEALGEKANVPEIFPVGSLEAVRGLTPSQVTQLYAAQFEN